MITPRFKLSQENNTVTINVRAPYCSLKELDVDADEDVFIFVCKPYYLRLTLPGKVVDDDRTKSSFDTDSGEFSFTYPKKYPGEHFKDLELITKLLTTKVDATCNGESIAVEVPSRPNIEELSPSDLQYRFGFAFKGKKDFARIFNEFDELFEIDPCEVPVEERRLLRLKHDQGKFDYEHYLVDIVDNYEICEIISQKCPFTDTRESSNFSFTDKELDFLKDLPNKQYDLSEESIKYCHNGLLDILFAYCYDQRTTYFEGNIESSWTISKLASTLSWNERFDNPKDAIISAFRRSLIYPLYRHFDLAQTAFGDLKELLELDEKNIIRVLINIYNIFLCGDCGRYILNDLFIKDYIIYIMKWDSDLWKSTVKDVLNLKLTKEDMGLNLKVFEESLELQNKFASMKISEEDDSDSSDSSSDSSSSGNSSESDSDSDDSSDPEDMAPNTKN